MTMTDDLPIEQVELIDPEDLSGAERSLLRRLQVAEPEEFDDELRRYVATPNESTQMVFRHPSIVQQTMDGLNRLMAASQRRVQHSTGRMKKVHAEQVQKIARERQVIRPWLNMAIMEASKHTSRARAERMLGRLMYAQLSSIKKDYDAGLPDPEVEARARQRLGLKPKGKAGKPAAGKSRPGSGESPSTKT